MSGIYKITMGDRGRLVIPSEVRRRSSLEPGTVLVLIDSPDGLLLVTREQLSERVRNDLEGHNLVKDLSAERRQAAALENAR